MTCLVCKAEPNRSAGDANTSVVRSHFLLECEADVAMVARQWAVDGMKESLTASCEQCLSDGIRETMMGSARRYFGAAERPIILIQSRQSRGTAVFLCAEGTKRMLSCHGDSAKFLGCRMGGRVWFKAAVLKTAVRATVPGVRIPPHPLLILR